MTGPSGNRLSICPLRFRIASPNISIDLASVNRNSWGGDPESLGANRSVYFALETSHYLFTNKQISQYIIIIYVRQLSKLFSLLRKEISVACYSAKGR